MRVVRLSSGGLPPLPPQMEFNIIASDLLIEVDINPPTPPGHVLKNMTLEHWNIISEHNSDTVATLE